MGSMQRWLGPTVEPFLIWAWERLNGNEDLVVVENVMLFDDMTLAKLMSPRFDVVCLKVCPTLLGLPIQRQRKYMLLVSKKLKWLPSVTAMGYQKAFEKLFARGIGMHGDQMMRAPEAEVREIIQKMATAQGLPLHRQSQKEWSYFLVMTGASRAAVEKHETAIMEAGHARTASLVVNLANNPEFIGARPNGLVPAVLRSSKLWSFAKKRGVLPSELLEMQGYNIHGDRPSAISDVLKDLTEPQVRELAGNGMHVQCVACVLAFALALTTRESET